MAPSSGLLARPPVPRRELLELWGQQCRCRAPPDRRPAEAASLEAERPLPPDPRNLPARRCPGCVFGAEMELIWASQPEVRGRDPGGSRCAPCLPAEGFLQSPADCCMLIHRTPPSWSFHPSPCPKACYPWAESKGFCLLGSLDWHFLFGGPEPGWTHLPGFAYTRHTHSSSSSSFHHHSQ